MSLECGRKPEHPKTYTARYTTYTGSLIHTSVEHTLFVTHTPVYLNNMSLECGRKPEHPEEAPPPAENMQTPHRLSGGRTHVLLHHPDAVRLAAPPCHPLYILWCAAEIHTAMGNMLSDGKVSVGLCDLVEPWDNLSMSQKKNLNYRYQSGCDCRIATCNSVPCATTEDGECLWTDWLLDNSLSGEQARHFACVKRTDGSCSWYRGGPPPDKDFLDMSDP
uniref:TIMP metallopeptidase inhibitor 4 n=1 Tax=Scleropages formosus TaxID=113540 RepID=A0A8C9TZI8_SCLFO